MSNSTFQFHIVATSRLTLEHIPNKPTSRLLYADVALEVSPGLDLDKYIEPKTEMPTADGCKSLIQAFTSGLVSAIRTAAHLGYKSEEDNLAFIANELRRGLDAAESAPTVEDY